MESNMASEGSNEQPTSTTAPNLQTIENKNLTSPLASTMTVAPSGLHLDLTLQQELKDHGIVPNIELFTRWKNGLGELDSLIMRCLTMLSSQNVTQTNTALQVSGKYFVVGSHLLGVANKGSELDVVVFAPKHIERKVFFGALIYIMQRLHGIPYLLGFEESHVPTLKMKLKGVTFNVSFVRVNLTIVPDQFDPVISQGLFEPDCVRTFNVYLAGKKIISLVPNWDTFRLALRAVKLWARLKGVYGRAFGYLGGISWAVLVARMCQELPDDNAASIVNQVFQTFSSWSWPQYVALKTDPENAIKNPAILSSDKDFMPILNPAHPHENTSRTCTPSCRDIILEELKKGASITKAIVSGQASWDKLFQLQDFFGSYGHYIVVKVSSDIQMDLLKSKRLVETRLQHLSHFLQMKIPDLKQVRLWPHGYKNENPENGHLTCSWFFGLEPESSDGKFLHPDRITMVVNKHKERLEKIKEETRVGPETAVTADYIEKDFLWRYISLAECASLPKTEAEW